MPPEWQAIRRPRRAEKDMAVTCLCGILATGDGTRQRPFLVSRVSDEYDLIRYCFSTNRNSQSLRIIDGHYYDVLACGNGKICWFDVTLTFKSNREAFLAAGKTGPSMPSALPAPGNAGLAAAAYQRGADAIDHHDYGKALVELDAAIRFDPSTPTPISNAGLPAPKGASPIWPSPISTKQSACGRTTPSRIINAALPRDRKATTIPRSRASTRRSRPRSISSWLGATGAWPGSASRSTANALVDFNEAIFLQPGDSIALSNRGFVWESLNDFSRAMADFNQALHLAPSYPQAYAGRGRAWIAKGEYDLAIADLDEAIRLMPGYAAAYEYRSAAYGKKGDQAQAQADQAKAAELRGSASAAKGGNAQAAAGMAKAGQPSPTAGQTAAQ